MTRHKILYIVRKDKFDWLLNKTLWTGKSSQSLRLVQTASQEESKEKFT